MLTALHHTFLHSADLGVWTVDWAIMATLYMVKFTRLRKKPDLVKGLLGLVLFVGFLGCYLHITLEVF